jgi:hypothetical protein
MIRIKSRKRAPRATALLEFVITLPFMLALLMFVMDAGRVFLAVGALSDATWRSAHVAGVIGGADSPSGGIDAAVTETFNRALTEVPGGDTLKGPTINVVDGLPRPSVCKLDGTVNSDVRLIGSGYVDSIVSSSLVGLGFSFPSKWNLKIVAVAACETEN